MSNANQKLWTRSDAEYETKLEELLIEIAVCTAIKPLEISATLVAMFGPESVRELFELENIRNFAARHGRLPLTEHELRRG